MTENVIRSGWLQVNLAKLRALGTQEVSEATLDTLLVKLRTVGECSIEEFREHFNDLTDEEYYQAVYQLVYFQEIYTNLIEQPLDELSRIRVQA
jgi:hypothetical protein